MQETPRGPIWKTSSDFRPQYVQDSEQNYLATMGRYREIAKEEAYNTARLSPELEFVQKYAACLMGQYWNRRRARYKSSFFDNRLDNSRQNDLALLTDTRPTIAVSSAIPAYKQQAEMAQITIQDEWTRHNMDLDLVRTVDICKLNGTAFWKIGAALPGRMQVIPCGPENVMPIQPGRDIQSSSAVMYQCWKGISYFRNKFPYNARGLERELEFTEYNNAGSDARYARPGEIPEYTWDGLSPQMKRVLAVQQQSASSTVPDTMFHNLQLQEFYIDDPTENDSKFDVLMRHPYLSLGQHNYWYWVKPGQRLYPRKRLLVYAGRRLMYDGPSPFWHGLYPFATMQLNPVPWSFYGMSKYRSLLPLNDAMNEIGAGIMDMIKRALNPTAVSKMGSVATATWKEFYPDMPGSKLMMMPNANIADLRYMEPPQIPGWVFQFHQYLAMEFDRLAGSIDVASMGKKKQVPGGDTIEAMRDMQNSITRLESRYIEKFLESVGAQAVSSFFQFWTLDTRLKTMGESGLSWADFQGDIGTLIPEDMPKETFWQRFGFKVASGSLLNNNRDREKTLAVGLAQHGLLPLSYLYSVLGLADPKGLLKELIAEHDAGIGGGSGKSSRMTRGQRTGKAA